MESQPQNPEFKLNPENFHPRAIKVLHYNEISLALSRDDLMIQMLAKCLFSLL